MATNNSNSLHHMAHAPMDPALWSKLPFHLLELVLAFLPITSLLRLQTVCKKWRATISSSSSFHQLLRLRSTPPSQLLLVFAGDHHVPHVSAYDSEFDKWHLIRSSNFFLDSDHPASQYYFSPVASDGGLFCLRVTGLQDDFMYVSNPITGGHRKLPRMHLYFDAYYSFHVVALIANTSTKGYKILAVQNKNFREPFLFHRKSLCSQVYDSESNTWSMTGTLHHSTPMISEAVFHRGFVYCLTCSPERVVAFDLDKGLWHETRLAMPSSLRGSHLLQIKGELMLISGIAKSGRLVGVYFWRLDDAAQKWVEVKRTPQSVFNMFFEPTLGIFQCVAVQDQVCFTGCRSAPELLLLVHDLVRDKWNFLPSNPDYDMSLLKNCHVSVRAFEPRFNASVQ